MKRYKNILNTALLAAAVVVCSVACSDEIDLDELRASSNTNKLSTAAPTITAFYAHSEYASGVEELTPVTKTEVGAYLVVAGENLQGATCITFNSDTLVMSDIYAQWDKIVLQIPTALPEVIDNVFTCTTEYGTVTESLKLVLPAAEFSQLSNGFTLPGASTSIQGANFSVYGFGTDRSQIILYNEAADYEEEVAVTYASDTSLSITVPAEAPDNSIFKFILDGEEHEQKLLYRPTDLFLFFNETSGATASGFELTYTDGSNSGDPTSLFPDGLDGESVYFYRVQGTSSASWSAIITIPATVEYNTSMFEDDKSGADYDLVYELWTNVSNPIPTGNTFYGWFSSVGTFGMWNDFGTVEINTGGKWVTYRTDLTKAFGSAVGEYNAITNFVIKKGGDAISDEQDCAFANFRIEPKLP